MCVAALGREAGKYMTGIGSCLGRKNFSSWQFSWHFWDTKAYGTNQKKRHALPPLFQHETNFQRIPPSTSFKKPKPNKHPLPSFIGETSARQQDSFSRKLPKNQVFFIYSHSCFPLESCETPATLKKIRQQKWEPFPLQPLKRSGADSRNIYTWAVRPTRPSGRTGPEPVSWNFMESSLRAERVGFSSSWHGHLLLEIP